jgi:hypothetical protein
MSAASAAKVDEEQSAVAISATERPVFFMVFSTDFRIKNKQSCAFEMTKVGISKLLGGTSQVYHFDQLLWSALNKSVANKST